MHIFLGLHTCGSLGSTVLKLFIKNSDASVLCVIPCCYNLMTECKEENTLFEMPEHTQNDTQSDFPMSSYLKGLFSANHTRDFLKFSIRYGGKYVIHEKYL